MEWSFRRHDVRDHLNVCVCVCTLYEWSFCVFPFFRFHRHDVYGGVSAPSCLFGWCRTCAHERARASATVGGSINRGRLPPPAATSCCVPREKKISISVPVRWPCAPVLSKALVTSMKPSMPNLVNSVIFFAGDQLVEKKKKSIPTCARVSRLCLAGGVYAVKADLYWEKSITTYTWLYHTGGRNTCEII